MTARSCLLFGFLLGALVLSGLAPSVASPQGSPLPVVVSDLDKPFDLILAVDVSGSMILPYGKAEAGSDPEGIRWDGLQFAIDISQDNDRIALVIYTADAAVITKFIPGAEDIGFLKMNEFYTLASGERVIGRKLLKNIVAELQLREQNLIRGKSIADLKKYVADEMPAAFCNFELKSLTCDKLEKPAKEFSLWGGTATVLALDTIQERAELLSRLSDGGKAWMFIFTDGREEKPYQPENRALYDKWDWTQDVMKDTKPHQYPYKTDAYEKYHKEMEQAKATDKDRPNTHQSLQKWVDQKLKSFREKGVPVFTFALGDDCDHELLDAMSNNSGVRLAAAYRPKNNVELFDNLQQVFWELREYWHKSVDSKTDGGHEVISAPKIAPWKDMGVLLYRQVKVKDGTANRAPTAPEDNRYPLIDRKPLKHLSPLTSSSHWYFSVTPKAVSDAGLSKDEPIEFRLPTPRPDGNE